MERMIGLLRRHITLNGDTFRERFVSGKYFLIGKEADKGFLFRLFLYIILIDTAFIYLKPILYMVGTMVKDASNMLDPSVIWVPRSIFTGHLKEAFELLQYQTSFFYSVSISLTVAVLQIISCAIAGYAFARLEFPFKRLWFMALVFTFILPPQLTILPSILMFKQIGWANTVLPMIVPALFGHGLKGALFVIIFKQFFSTLPKELEEAARMDGANAFRFFFKVMLPLSKSAIIVVFLFSFVWNWNDFYLPSMYMSGSKDVPLSISLAKLAASLNAEAAQGGTSIFAEPIKMAASFLIITPVLIVYAIAQRWFVEGIERTGLVE
ncbi:ABC transporter permease subunit [Paenibacillus sp. 5J-6]|uniref:ABC transporter permease subunit n=1 Tax=Paenibacillus silvestris TaxID=2606219 RepID=A0A6L8V4E8_9BACL|nr:carbohydrate ABC transporter permease [Paenibacillus silvestris]MZQ85298.1 ABC transporter permease subunit [Paenibacillus silvestris]